MKYPIAITLMMSLLVSGAEKLTAPIDSQLPQQSASAARAAAQEGNWAVALREYRRILEFFPNEPLVRAGVYAAMAEAMRKSGDTARANEYAATARRLDPKLDERAESVSAGPGITRGERADQLSVFLSAALQTAAAVAQANMQRRDAQRMATQQQQQMQQQQLQMQQMQQMQQGQMQQPQPGVAPGQPPMAPGYAYPTAPVGQPGYQPYPNQPAMPSPAAPYPSPTPGQPVYQPSPVQPGFPPQAASPYPPPSPASPYPPQAPGQPVYQPSPGQPAYPPQYAPQPVYQAPPPGYTPPPDPYAASGYRPSAAVVRGDAAKPWRVVHDHSHPGDTAYFATGCGALLSVDGQNLIFTPAASDEAPKVIPSSEIWEIRLNTIAGKEVGAFHISTRKGLYLNLAAESGNRDDARVLIEALRKQLGLEGESK